MNDVLEIFVGYDEREDEAYQVCVASLLAHASRPVRVRTLDVRVLRAEGMFWRPQRRNPYGGGLDLVDKRPVSTHFAFTRFLVPFLSENVWSLFVDLDFMFRDDVTKLFALANPLYALMCVQHDYLPTESVKMDGARQEPYLRKNWSSLMLWNNKHSANDALTLDKVNSESGRWLHQFSWLDDKVIGSIPEKWNWLCGHSSFDIEPKAVHFTRGIPTMPDHVHEPYADEWRLHYAGQYQ